MKARPVAAISFDADGTLWDFRSVMRRSLECVLAELRRRVPRGSADDLTVQGMIDIRDAVAVSMPRATHEEIRLEAFRRTLQSVGSQDESLAADLYALYMKHRFEDIQLYDDVIPALEALPRWVKIGLVSNGNTYPGRCGLAGRFNFTVFAQEHGCRKPNPKLFITAARRAACGPNEMLHVGDSLDEDVAGARRAGILAVWLNRTGEPVVGDIRPDFEIATLRELPPLAVGLGGDSKPA